MTKRREFINKSVKFTTGLAMGSLGFEDSNTKFKVGYPAVQPKQTKNGLRQVEKLSERINKIPVIDTHEHMNMEAVFVAGKYDFADLMAYVGLDIGLAGMDAEPWGAAQGKIRQGKDINEKWQRIKPFWKYVHTGSYGRFERRVFQRFFNVDDLNDQTVHEISDRIPEYQHKGVYQEYIQDKYGVRVMLKAHDNSPVPEPKYFAPIYTFCSLAGTYSAKDASAALGEALPTDVGDYHKKVEQCIETAVASGAVGLKIGMTARRRSLDFCAHSDEQIQTSYKFLREQANGDWLNKENCARLKPFQDATFWTVFGKAGELGLPVQIHSGLEFAQPWDGRPSVLIPSIIRFPLTKFAIFHGSYPYMDELTGLAKSFPNVYLDLAWFHLFPEQQSRMWLSTWLDVLPHNKIFGFGGDVFHFFGVCAHLEIARENIVAVLSDRINRGISDIDDAEQVAKLLLQDNAMQTFKFSNWKGYVNSPV